MQVSVEKTHNLGRRITITIPAVNIKDMVQTKLVHVAQQIRMDGFRQGKVPMKIVAQRYGMSILNEVLTDLMQQEFITVIKKNNFVPVGNLSYMPGEYKEGSDFTYIIEFEIAPEIQLKNFDSIKVNKPIVEVNEEDIDNILIDLCRKQGVWKPVTRPVQVGDRVTIELINLEQPENDNKVNNLSLIIAPESTMYFDLDKQIIGHILGDNFIVELNFPEKEKNNITQFNILLKKVEECQLPEFNKKFIKHLEVSESKGSIVKLRDEIRQNLQRELKNTVNYFLKLQIFHELLTNNKIEIPISLLKTEVKNLYQLSSMKIFPRSILEKKAKNRVTLGLLLNEVIRMNKLNVKEEHIQPLIKYFRKSQETMKSIQNLVLENMAIELIMNQCVITEKKMQFQDLKRMIVEYEQNLIY
ncbi:MAG: trigger factor [Candidatus Dasytiphilus stammeri]